MTPQRVIDRVLSNVERAGDCVVSTYSTGSHGYAQVGWWWEDGSVAMSLCHRVAWEAAYGPIPDGLTVDHLCRNRQCIRIDHLRLLTNEENGRGNGNSIKTECPREHPYDPWNTYVDPKGHRRCRECARITKAERSARRRAA